MIPALAVAIAAGAALALTRSRGGSAPNERWHEHRCRICGYGWWHGPGSSRRAHTCRRCGHLQTIISRWR